jgi:Ca2+/H+ antiporter
MQGDAHVRNISNTGRRNRFYGSMALFLFAIVVNIAYLVVGNPPTLNPDYNPTILIVTAITLSGLYIAGFLVLLESTTQVCVYHGFLGTHESSSGGKKHEDESVSRACRSKSWSIIFQSIFFGIILTVFSLWLLSEFMVS